MITFENKKVLLTGATRGIGLACLKKLLKLGAQVFVTGRDEKAIESLKTLETANGGCIAGSFVGDISTTGTQCADEAIKTMGNIDIFIHSAGITKDNLMIRLTEADWDQVQSVNLKSAFTLSQACVSNMMRNRYGRIVFVTSVVGSVGNSGQANYIASKAGLAGLAKGIAHEYAKRGITVNCVEPGFIDTDMTSSLPDAKKEQLMASIPMSRMGTPDEVANCILFLASQEASYVTGSSLRVNGGMCMY